MVYKQGKFPAEPTSSSDPEGYCIISTGISLTLSYSLVPGHCAQRSYSIRIEHFGPHQLFIANTPEIWLYQSAALISKAIMCKKTPPSYSAYLHSANFESYLLSLLTKIDVFMLSASQQNREEEKGSTILLKLQVEDNNSLVSRLISAWAMTGTTATLAPDRQNSPKIFITSDTTRRKQHLGSSLVGIVRLNYL